MDNSKNKKNSSSETSSYVRYSGLAFQMMVTIGLGVWGGIKLDEWLGLRPLFTVSLSLLAVIGSLVQLIRGLPK
jgi:F0F1-type ATP synthase assembly protein I